MSNPARGTTKNGKTARKRKYGVDSTGSGQASWSEVSAANVLELIQAASNAGGAIRFGVSRDGGAYALGIYGDGPEVYSLYSGSLEGIELHIANLYEVFEEIAKELGSKS